jgi:D-alanyl-D-alanine carboxypeptidase/D-alanyl-D-alanine-endopeptidase (penicillin-binding protein 4)
MHPELADSQPLNLFTGGNSPDAKPYAVLALRLDMSASVIASAPLPHFRWRRRINLRYSGNVIALNFPDRLTHCLTLLALQWVVFPNPVSAVSSASPALCPAQLDSEIAAIRSQHFPENRETWGILVETIDGETLYSHNARQYITPASNTKLLTTAAALQQLGPQYRIRTAIYQTPDGLRIVGAGDPSITQAQLDDLAQQVAAAGIRQIDRLVAEDAYFQGSLYNPHWQWEDVQAAYGAPVNSLIFEENSIPLTLFPQNVGQPLRLEWEDAAEGKFWQVDNQTVTVAAGEPEFIELERSLTEPILSVRGQLIAGSQPEATAVAEIDPAQRFVDRLERALVAVGVQVGGTEIVTESVEVGDGVEIAAIESPSLAELVTQVNQESNNLYAEAILRSLGAESDPTHSSSAAAGLEAVQHALTELGVDPSSYTLSDGSGLSRLNAISPEALVQTLQAMAQSPFAATYLDSLPLAGETGTLRNRFAGTPARGNVRAKTGTISGVLALSGYIYPDTPQALVFSIAVNYADRSVGLQREAIDAIVLLLLRLQSCP